MISSKTLRAERRAKAFKKVAKGVLAIAGIILAIAMLWIIQVGVTSI